MPPPYCYDYPRPAVTVDVVAFGLEGASLRVLLIRRGKEPYKGKWALPGGFLEMEEQAAEGARRELLEETGLEIDGWIWPLGFYAEPDRDPRGRTISLAYVGFVRGPLPKPTGSDDATEAKWMAVDVTATGKLGKKLAFDHWVVLLGAIVWLLTDLKDGSESLGLLPDEFTREDVKRLFQAVGLKNDGSSWLRERIRSGDAERMGGRPVRYRALERS